MADVHRILTRGGVFLDPCDRREPEEPGKLRLRYEASPMAFLVVKAGAWPPTGASASSDVQPTRRHERVRVLLGARNEVERVPRYHHEAAA